MSHDLHPIVAQMHPSEEQLPPILARGSYVVVTAGAGAGKTRTLVARYLSLLVDAAAGRAEIPVRSVVAITFTKKAAREMRNRVREEVRRYLQREGLTEEERARWQAVYEQLDAARIGTIHSLCAEILRRHPAEIGIDPRFGLLEEGEISLLQAQAIDAALGWAANDPEGVRLFTTFRERDLRPILSALMLKRLDVADVRARLPKDAWTVWEPQVVAPIRAFLCDLEVQRAMGELVGLRTQGDLARAEAKGDALAPDLKCALELWDTLSSAQRAGDWLTISRCLLPFRASLKQKGTKAAWAPAEPKPIIKAVQARYDELLAPLFGRGLATETRCDLALDRILARDILPLLLGLFDRAVAHYERAKRARQSVDFDDLEAEALRLLSSHPEVRAYWQREIAALLVDEAQDTNGRQRDLLRLLNGAENRLFIVGDGKQSIYRFRGADVSVFRGERRAIAEAGLDFALATSYRAHGGLISVLNSLLRPVLGDTEDARRPYVEPFAALAPHRTAPPQGLAPPYVELHLALGPKSDGALGRTAEALAARLVELISRQQILLERPDPESGERRVRPLDYGDVAILCRASGSFAAYEDAFERAGIPYLTIAGRGFYDRPEVRDLLNALRALADPTDDLTLAGLLRSPACGLSDGALYRLRDAQRDQSMASLWACLVSGDLNALGDEAERAVEARTLIDSLHQKVGRVPVAEVLKAFLDATAYRAALLRIGQTRAAANTAKLLSDAHASGIVGVGAFADYIAELRDVAPREGEARTLTTGAVQIMSVHQAKGLEFPIVVLGDAARSAVGGGGVLIDPELGIIPPCSTEIEDPLSEGEDVRRVSSVIYRIAQLRDSDRDAAEADRLLYVAATRAEEMLLVSGTASVAKDGGIGLAGWLKQLDQALGLRTAAPPCSLDGDSVHRFTLQLDEQAVGCLLYEPQAKLQPAVAGRFMPEEPAFTPISLPDPVLLGPIAAPRAQVDSAVQAVDRDPPRRVWRVVPQAERAYAPAWVVGQLVHQALIDWRFPDPADLHLHPGDISEFYTWAAAGARAYGLTDAATHLNAARRVARMLAVFQASELYAEMAEAEICLHEVPYSLVSPEGHLEHGIIDALYRRADEWVLVEFKSDRIRDEAELQRVLRERDYREQLLRYLEATERLLGERPKPVLCFLAYANRVRLVTDMNQAL